MAAELRLINRAPLAKDIQFGGGGIGGLFATVTDEQADATLRKALELGIVQFDTAPLYGAGLSEERFGKVLPGTNSEITTKCGRLVISAADVPKYPENVVEKQMKEFWSFDGTDRLAQFGVILDYSAAAVRKSVEESRRRLGGMPIKCLRLHDAEDEERYEWATREGTVKEMVRLREEGIIKEVSLGMNDAKYLMRHVLDHPPGTFDNIMVAGCWNLLDQSGYELLKVCQERGIKIHQAGVFGSGVLWGSSHLRYGAVPEEAADRVRRWEALCQRHNVRLPEAALAFAYLPDIVEYVCVGCKKPEHVETNLALCGHKVPQALWEEAKKEGLLPEWLPLPKDE